MAESPRPHELDRLADLARRLDWPATFCVQDRMALEIRAGLAERGLRAPLAVGVARYDNVAGALASGAADLTSLGFPRERMAALAAEIIRTLRRDPSLAREQLFVKPELHVRGSTGGPASERDPALLIVRDTPRHMRDVLSMTAGPR